jgi:hypothetical protein
MFNGWFGKKNDTTDSRVSGSENNCRENWPSTERNDNVRGLPTPAPASADLADRSNRRLFTAPNPPPFDQIYQTATVKPAKIAYGIQKVAEMGNSPHLAGMSFALKQKALLMALEAAGTDAAEVLNDVVIRQRALKEYEESYLEKVNQFEAAQLEQNRLQKAELERITSQVKASIEASLDEVKRWHKGFREWQKSKQQEIQKLSEAAALCVTHETAQEEQSEGNVMAIAQRAGGAYR